MQASSSQTNYIFIDGSYFIYHRVFSIVAWWKRAHPDTPLNCQTILENTEFMATFERTFRETLKDLPKHLCIPQGEKIHLLAARDCKRDDIWRMELLPEYKGTRVLSPNNKELLNQLFPYVYEKELFTKGGVSAVLFHPHLEADDCIALSVCRPPQEKAKIFIVASDKDYLQLTQDPRVQIFDLTFKNISLNKSSNDDGACDLFCKIVMGDTSDNISSVLKKCGPKTAFKCWNDRAYFEDRVAKEGAQAKYELNQRLVDFKNIPPLLAAEFYKEYPVKK